MTTICCRAATFHRDDLQSYGDCISAAVDQISPNRRHDRLLATQSGPDGTSTPERTELYASPFVAVTGSLGTFASLLDKACKQRVRRFGHPAVIIPLQFQQFQIAVSRFFQHPPQVGVFLVAPE